MADFNCSFSEAENFTCAFDDSSSFTADFGVEIPVSDYTGSYTITPSSETQILSTQDRLLGADITINPIPSNYGLITWDGASLTVS